MVRRSQLIVELNRFPADARVRADEGEITCITVLACGKDAQYGAHFPLGYIVAGENDRAFEGHAVLDGQDEQ